MANVCRLDVRLPILVNVTLDTMVSLECRRMGRGRFAKMQRNNECESSACALPVSHPAVLMFFVTSLCMEDAPDFRV
jgi:hypothetical protein